MRIEDGIFTKCYITVADINAEYGVHNVTRKANAADVSSGAVGVDGDPVTSTDDDIYQTPSSAGVGKKIYTNAVGGDNGTLVTFKIASGSTIQITVYAGMMLPLVTTGCDTAGLLILA